MLRLLNITLCERAISGVDGTFSMIDVFETREFVVPAGAPSKFLSPLEWNVVIVWISDDDGDVQTTYEQRVTVKTPDGDYPFNPVSTSFVFPGNTPFLRNIVHFNGFPVSVSGRIEITVLLRRDGQNEWEEIHNHPLELMRSLDPAVDGVDDTSKSAEKNN